LAPQTFTADTLAHGPPLGTADAAGPADAALARTISQDPGRDDDESAGMELVPAQSGSGIRSPTMRAPAPPADPLDAAGQAASRAAKEHREQVLRGLRRMKDTLLEAADEAAKESKASASGEPSSGRQKKGRILPDSSREIRKRPWELIRGAANDLGTLQSVLEDAVERHAEAEDAARRAAGESLASRKAVEAQLAAVVHALHDLHERHSDIEARRAKEAAAKEREITRLRRAVDMQAEAGHAVMSEAEDGARMLVSRAVHERAVAEEAQARADDAIRRAAIA